MARYFSFMMASFSGLPRNGILMVLLVSCSICIRRLMEGGRRERRGGEGGRGGEKGNKWERQGERGRERERRGAREREGKREVAYCVAMSVFLKCLSLVI